MNLLREFLSRYNISSCLVAFSGGADSLCLLLDLLKCQKIHPLRIEVAHVDHGWRKESEQEAAFLASWVESLPLPFHQKRLSWDGLKGNLEEMSRDARYQFFREVCQERGLQGVMVAHHQGDLAETTLKRFLEGASFLKLSAMQPVSIHHGIPIWRPFLSRSRKEIENLVRSAPIQPLQDPTNRDVRFLRSRLRHVILPHLAQQFGKEIQQGIVAIAEEATELTGYFRERFALLLAKSVSGPLGRWANWQQNLPFTHLEIRYLLRFFLESANVTLSREILHRAALGLMREEAGLSFPFREGALYIDRRQVFLLNAAARMTSSVIFSSPLKKPLAWGPFVLQTGSTHSLCLWQGQLPIHLAPGEYRVGIPDRDALFVPTNKPLKSWWNKHRVPVCLRTLFPVVWKENRIVHEFLVPWLRHSTSPSS